VARTIVAAATNPGAYGIGSPGTPTVRSRALASAAEIHSDRRLPSLTGLRIFAALAVYLSHIGAPHGSPELVATFFNSGYSGVTLFFVLSGFVLALNYFDEFRSPHLRSTYNFFVARFARIYPLYIAVLLFIVVRDHATGIPIDNWWQNALAIQAWSPDLFRAFSFDAPAWSLSVEFFLYACFPLLVPLIGRIRRPRSLLITAGVIAAAMLALAAVFVITGDSALLREDPASAHRWLYRTPLTRLGDFALGILAARLFFATRGNARLPRLGSVLAIGAAVVFMLEMAWPAMFSSAWSWDVAYAIPTVVLIFGLAVAPRGPLARFLSIPALVLLGEASYAFYLVHQPAIDWFGGGGWLTAMSPTQGLNEAFVLAAILALAIGLHVGLELPARRHLRRRLSKRQTEPAEPPKRPEPTPAET
jgi:peptidoglycan/LPS O-acetylase OafA/YrhL